MASVDSIIPSRLIDLAEQKEACKEAVEWLRAKPRTFRELAENIYWVPWAADNLLSFPARKVYYKASAEAWEAYKEARASALAESLEKEFTEFFAER